MTKPPGILKWVLGGTVAVLLILPAPSQAAHKGYETSCYRCHTLNPNDGEPGTSFISATAKTLPEMKAALGVATWNDLPTPQNFGCTFCHSSLAVHGAPMAAILDDFSAQTFKHPVGLDYRTGTNNDNEYLSRGKSETGYFRNDAGPATNVPGSLECIGCHDPNLVTYPNHDGNWRDNVGAPGLTKATNPSALRGFTEADNDARWNDFCGNLCHNYTGAGADNNTVLASGRSRHGITAGDIDNTSKGNCVSCHGGHKADQDDLVPSSVATPSDCGNCHSKTNYAGSAQTGPDGTAYMSGGHGKATAESGATMGLACLSCHVATTAADNATRHALPSPADMSPDKNPKMRYAHDDNAGPCYPCHDKSHLHHGLSYSPAGNPAGSCLTCHEPHGGGQGISTSVNRKMIKTKIDVPLGGAPAPYDNYAFGTEAGGDSQTVDFRAKAGATGSFNPGADNTGNSSGVCVVCHDNAPPATSAFRSIANHAGGTTGDTNCFTCHEKIGGGAPTGAGGFPASACNGCHSFPGLDNTAANLKQMSAGHWKHVGEPAPVGTGNSRGYECAQCHFSYSHNETGVAEGQAWPAGYFANVDVNFDPAWNPANVNGPMYNGVNTPTAGNGGTGACGGLYCHGNNAALNAGWAGSAPQPVWNGSAACGACHDAGPADTTPGASVSTGNHAAHLAAAYGPGISAFTTDGNCAEGAGCHTAYGLSPTASHASHQPDFRSSPSDSGPVSLGATQICRNCHSAYASSAGIGDTLVRTQANWDNSAYKLPCVTCHNSAPAANTPPDAQATAGLDGLGDRAPDIDGFYYTGGGHGDGAIDNAATPLAPSAVLCTSCHDASLAHIGPAKNATNPWRLSAATNFALSGGLDDYCAVACHAAGAPADHSWRITVTAPVTAETKDATDTHPTSAAAVGAGKARWYQVPADTNVPLQGNLTQRPHTKVESENIVCVSCHDPHGAGATALPATVRNFSGGITEAARRMLRYNYSNVDNTQTSLCALCHI